LNHTFVVPGGRFREQYYWDSFWIVEGLIRSELYDVIDSTLQNFMDELEHIGFIPNGGRIYYLNRSQPPLFMKMLYAYVKASNNTSILKRALPLAEKELDWWQTNRTISVTSPYSKKTWKVARYAVVNTAPRPEGYLPDYLTANGPDIKKPYTEQEKEALYAELASGAETGWDYSSRWLKTPYAGNTTDTNPKLRSLNVRSTIPVDLNSILYNYRIQLAELYDLDNSHQKRAPSPSTQGRAAHHRAVAATLKSAILDLFWDSKRLAFYDFNLTSHARGTIFTAAHFYPFWNDIIPDVVANNEKNAFGAMSSLNLVMRRYNGTFPVTFIESGLQWDYPNAWPPHQYIALQALLHLPKKVKTQPLPPVSSKQTSFSYIPNNQLGLSASQLPPQPLASGQTTTADINAIGSGTVNNGGNATNNEDWATALGRELANRYIASAFCSWYATGGSIPGVLPQLSPEELNVTYSDPSSTGHMFEKFNAADIDIAGSGGEYTVQAGFGWTNGAVLWAADTYGKMLAQPQCPTI
jgi:alpha,alpha-trehalase